MTVEPPPITKAIHVAIGIPTGGDGYLLAAEYKVQEQLVQMVRDRLQRDAAFRQLLVDARWITPDQAVEAAKLGDDDAQAQDTAE